MGSHRRKYRSYGTFKLPMALKKFHITRITQNSNSELYQSFIQELVQKRDFTPSHEFNKYFSLGRTIFLETAGPSEKMCKSWLIWPFLLEMQERHPKLKIWEEITLAANPAEGLTVEPDYVVTKKSDIIEAPYCIIMEAKQMDFSQGWGQALTAMKGAQILNKQESGIEIPIYGVVSTGDLWQFGKLMKQEEQQKQPFVMYPSTVPFNVLDTDEKVEQALDIIFEECEKNLE